MLVHNFYHLVALSFLAGSQSRKGVLEDGVGEMFLVVFFGDVGYIIFQRHRHSLHHCFAFLIVQHTVHFGVFSRGVGVLFEKASNSGGSLITAAARFDMGLHLLLVVFDLGGFADDYL